MPQLLESTRNYLKSSTKLGRRLSSYPDDSSTSDASLHDTVAPSTVETLKPQSQKQHRPSPQNRLSSLFTLESRNSNSISSEDRVTVNVLSRKVAPDAQDSQLQQQDNRKKRRNSSSRKSSQSHHVSPTSPPPALADRRASSYVSEGGLPRGRSPTLSVSNTMSTRSSYYEVSPEDYPSVGQYQAHVWRRNLLEESIMHSLGLGYGESRPQSAQSSRSPKRSTTDRSRRAMSKDLLPHPTEADRDMSSSSNNRAPQGQKGVKNNSPYQMLLNPSTSNVTHSFASFTLELPDHQVTHVMSSSVVPNLFKIKMANSESRSTRPRRGSNASRILKTGSGPSPRVLTGKVVSSEQAESKENMDPLQTLHVAAAV
ncbi:hypothetical protein EDD21DRAFT_61879 [Dissophora ornata]|nr:hypothetical protein BGZ58_002922 [Dissophora ornata]KAI8594941.1 hypothetical protein EDD21DRAFT_61879 [Dissophora ornata]